MTRAYPETPAERTRWILAKRGARNEVSAERPYAFFTEQERTGAGESAGVSTIFLTNRECPWKCAICDLWKNTTLRPVPPGAITRQIAYALERMPASKIAKLYNSGSFFDAGAIARAEWSGIAELCAPFEHVIVECHPRLINEVVLEFAARLSGTLEIAMGLETCQPAALEALNKRFTVADYAGAANFLRAGGIAVRTFLLVHPPLIDPREQAHWLHESMRFSFDAGSSVVSLIPTRLGNGAMEAFGAREPELDELESAQEFGLGLGRGRVFADAWELDRFAKCPSCAEARAQRLARMNLSQLPEPRISCPACGK